MRLKESFFNVQFFQFTRMVNHYVTTSLFAVLGQSRSEGFNQINGNKLYAIYADAKSPLLIERKLGLLFCCEWDNKDIDLFNEPIAFLRFNFVIIFRRIFCWIREWLASCLAAVSPVEFSTCEGGNGACSLFLSIELIIRLTANFKCCWVKKSESFTDFYLLVIEVVLSDASIHFLHSFIARLADKIQKLVNLFTLPSCP